MPKETHRVTMTTTADADMKWFPPVFVADWVTRMGVHIPDLTDDSVVQAHVSDELIRIVDLTDANLVNYWALHPFGTGTYTDLVSSADVDVTGTGTKSESNIDGHGIALSGTAQYLTADSATTCDITTGDFSIMIVFKLAATVSAVTLAAKRAGAAGDGQGWEIGLDSDGYPIITLEDADSTSTYTSGTTALDDGKIHTLHFTVDRNSATGYLTYIDGALDGTNGDPSGEQLTLTTTKAMTLGCNSHGTPANLLTGTIYRFAYWTDIRTAAEVKADYYGGFAPIAAPAGTVLPVCASASDPITADLSDFASFARGRVIALKCATTQTGGPYTAIWYFN
jgi:hypothetical protein